MLVDLMHISMQYSDTSSQQATDTNKVFSRAKNRKVWWVTGTEANHASDAAIFKKGAEDHGYKFFKGGGDVWIAVDSTRTVGNIQQQWVEIIPGVAGRHPNTGILRITFKTKSIGEVTVLAGHYVLPDAPNEKMAREIGRQAREFGGGNKLVFYGGDQNMHEKRLDTFWGEPLTSAWDELKHWEPTHGKDCIDVIASYNKDTRVKAEYCRAKNDSVFKLNTDHFLVEAGYEVKPLS
jgi:hypothetical protein